jgi:deazaflavin-dependent oxidoreductase (nitroreductase family)
MSDEIRQELLKGGVIDITSKGRRTGEQRRIEVRLHNVDGQLYLSGAPGKRNWYANLLATPQFQVHLKRDMFADLDAFAVPVLEDSERRRVFRVILTNTGNIEQLDDRMKSSPLVHVSVTVGS